MKRWLPYVVVVLTMSLAPIAFASNMALELQGDPDSYFHVPDAPSLDADLADHFTVEAWVYPYIATGENMILNKEDAYELAVKDDRFQVAVRPVFNSWAWVDSGATVKANEWTHVAMTFDGTTITMFVNGELVGTSTAWRGKLNDSVDALMIGRRTRGGATHSIYTGLIDEVHISKVIRYDGAFSVPTAPFEADENTVALYHFDEAIDSVVADASSAKNDGTLMKDAKLVPVENGPFK